MEESHVYNLDYTMIDIFLEKEDLKLIKVGI